MKMREDWPYLVRDGLPVVDEWRPTAELVLGHLKALIQGAEAAGVRLRVQDRDGKIHELSAEPYAVQWVHRSGQVYFVAELPVIGITEAAEMLGMHRSALYGRIDRANRFGQPMPFRRNPDGGGGWFAYPDEVKKWAASWTGRRAIRRRIPRIIPGATNAPIA
jgi:hypothetical protein